MQFCNTPLSTCEEEPFGNTHVFWWQLLITKKSHTSACRYSMPRGVLKLLRLLAVTENQETQCGFWTRFNGSRVCMITNITAASAFLADGWSTESVSRVVRTTRTKQENNDREHATRKLQPRTRRSDDFLLFCSHRTGFEEDENLTESTTAQDDQENETRRQTSRIH